MKHRCCFFFLSFFVLALVSGRLRACEPGDHERCYRPEAVCDSAHASVEERARQILGGTEARALKTAVIDAPMGASRLEMKERQGRQTSGLATQGLFVTVDEGSRRFSRDVTVYDAVVFRDGLLVFPAFHDVLHVLSDAGFADAALRQIHERLETRHTGMSFVEVLSALDISLLPVFFASPVSLTYSCLIIRVAPRSGVASFSGMLHQNLAAALVVLHQHFPDVKRLHLHDIPGTNEARGVFEAAFVVRWLGLETAVGKESRVYSGGVDFFFAGVRQFFEEGAILVDHGWKSSSYRLSSSVMAQGAPGSACSRQQRLMDETYSTLHYPALLRQLTAHLSPEEYHRFTADELVQMGVIVVDAPDAG